MSNIDFQNGFMLGLLLSYKQEAEGGAFGSMIIKMLTDVVRLEDFRLVAIDSTDCIFDEDSNAAILDYYSLVEFVAGDDASITLI